MLPPMGSEPRVSDFTALHATIWANSISWKSLAFRSLYIHALLILGLGQIFGINTAWLYIYRMHLYLGKTQLFPFHAYESSTSLFDQVSTSMLLEISWVFRIMEASLKSHNVTSDYIYF